MRARLLFLLLLLLWGILLSAFILNMNRSDGPHTSLSFEPQRGKIQKNFSSRHMDAGVTLRINWTKSDRCQFVRDSTALGWLQPCSRAYCFIEAALSIFISLWIKFPIESFRPYLKLGRFSTVRELGVKKTVYVSYYLTDKLIPLVAWIPSTHYSGMYGLLKLALPQILPINLHRVIVLDTDIVFAWDIALLWSFFERFSAEQSLGLVENQSDWYLKKTSYNISHWPAKDRGYNTGVLLMDLSKMRQNRWMDVWQHITQRDLSIIHITTLADQDIFNSVLKDFPTMVYDLPCVWNVQLGQISKSEELCPDSQTSLIYKIIHWNSPKKMQVDHRLGRYYKDVYQSVVAQNGNFLCGGILGCFNSTLNDSRTPHVKSSDPCYEFERLSNLKFRTHLYFIEYSYQSSGPTDVTLVTQLSFDRLQMLEPLSDHWKGPISLALYMSDLEAQQLAEYIFNSNILSHRKNIGYHIVYNDGVIYPVNYLRNAALNQVNTPFVFLTDIDLLPMYGLYEMLKKNVAQIGLTKQETNFKKTLVVPAFETHQYRAFSYPANKKILLRMMAKGDVIPVRSDIWKPGHHATNYLKWKNATKWYTVKWEPNYEPYIVVSRNVPRFDNRFGGSGGDKVSHLMTLTIKGYELIVLPGAFTIHMPHTLSLDTTNFLQKAQHKNCTARLRKEFARDLQAAHGMRVMKWIKSWLDPKSDSTKKKKTLRNQKLSKKLLQPSLTKSKVNR